MVQILSPKKEAPKPVRAKKEEDREGVAKAKPARGEESGGRRGRGQGRERRIMRKPKKKGKLKLKTNRAARKRFKLTATGKVKRHTAFKRHILTKKASGRKRGLRKAVAGLRRGHAEREADAAGLGRQHSALRERAEG